MEIQHLAPQTNQNLRKYNKYIQKASKTNGKPIKTNPKIGFAYKTCIKTKKNKKNNFERNYGGGGGGRSSHKEIYDFLV